MKAEARKMTKDDNGIPEKPKTERGFARPVAWLLGRQLIANLKYIAMYAAFKGKLDARDWMSTRVYSFTGRPGTREPSEIDIEPINHTSHAADGEFWFDYLADSGDGQMAVYSIAYLCMSDLWIDAPQGWEEGSPQEIKKLIDEGKIEVRFVENSAKLAELEASGRKTLPRGAFLFVGGDTSYHISDYATLAERFQNPFTWAYRDLLKDGKTPEELGQRHPLFGIPGNHDYYDALDGFNRQFRRPATGEDVAATQRSPLLAIPTFMRCQEASYIALELPHNWWFWGFDTENGDMDFRQREFFKRLKEKINPRKLIVATSQPTTVFGKYASPDSPLVEELKGLGLERPFLQDAPKLDPSQCRLDLSGDVHHYARYWGPDSSSLPGANESANNYASVVSGIGGAFLHPSQTDVGEVEEQTIFPTKETSRRVIAEQILNFWNLVTGGYVWLIGFVLSAILYFGATIPQSSRQVVACFPLFSELLKITRCEQVTPTVRFSVPADQIYYYGANAVSRPSGYFWWAVSLGISIIAIIGLITYSNYLFKEIYREQARKKEAAISEPLTLLQIATSKNFWRFWILLIVALLSLIYGMWNFTFSISPAGITPFGCSMLVLVSLVWGVCAIIECFLYSEWLFHQAYDLPVRWYDYWPIWVLVAFAVAVTGSSLWHFGNYNLAAYLMSDIVFALSITAVFLGLILFAVTTGGALKSASGKVLFGLFGLWHAVLQLFVPFLLVVRGSLVSFVAIVISIFFFRWLGVRLGRKHTPWLAALWLVYGIWMLYVPFLLPAERALLPIASDLLIRYLPFLDSPRFPSILACIAAGLVGLVMTCVSFGWYLAASLAFNGHNNEAGGAARIEGFKGFIRIHITSEALTAYVIGFEKPEMEGSKLKVGIIDMFQLKSDSKGA
jgi:hypothetical protein